MSWNAINCKTTHCCHLLEIKVANIHFCSISWSRNMYYDPLTDDKKVIKPLEKHWTRRRNKNVDESFMCPCPFLNVRCTNRRRAMWGRENWRMNAGRIENKEGPACVFWKKKLETRKSIASKFYISSHLKNAPERVVECRRQT